MALDRRSFIRGLIAAPAVVSFASLMPVRGVIMGIAPPVIALPHQMMFRYVVAFGDDATKPIAWHDFGSSIQMVDGDTFTLALPDGKNLTFNRSSDTIEEGDHVYMLLNALPA